MVTTKLSGWIGPLIATVIGAILRFPGLGTPKSLIFDETYYAKDSLALLNFGYERGAVEGADKLLIDSGGIGYEKIFTDQPSFVVHPPLGKWMIAFTENLFGATPVGWRIIMAIVGTLSILIAARIARRLTGSNLVGTLTGLLLAFDGLHIVMSRTALLDTPLALFILCAFGCLIIDRDIRLEKINQQVTLGFPWWRIGTAVFLGCAFATKWSALYYIAAFLILMLVWDLKLGRTFPEVASPLSRLWRWVVASIGSMAIIVTVYLTSWIGWFRSTNAWDRQWANGQPPNIFPNTLRSLWHYHYEMFNFHVHLNSPHNYRANAWGWPLMIRPTSFFYESKPTCGAVTCSQEVIPLGNPIIWWGGAIALAYVLYLAIRFKSSSATAILTGFAAGWVPWLFFPNRTTFTFYAIVFIPFTAMALALALAHINDRLTEKSLEYVGPAHFKWLRGNWPVIGVVATVIALAIFFAPIYYGHSIPYEHWNLRMWFKSWI